MPTFIALLHKESDSDFGVTFVDFPGCVSAAGDLEGLRCGAVEALTLHIEGMVEDGLEIPQPTSLNEYTGCPDTDPSLPIMLIEAPVAVPKAVRVNITLPEDVLRAIDKVTGNRSRFLADAARAKLRVA